MTLSETAENKKGAHAVVGRVKLGLQKITARFLTCVVSMQVGFALDTDDGRCDAGGNGNSS